MLLKDSHLIYYNFLIKKKKLWKWTRCANFALGNTSLSILMRQDRSKKFSNSPELSSHGWQSNMVLVIIGMAAKKNQFLRLWQQKTKIVTTEDFWLLQFLSFFNKRKFWLPNNSHLINNGSISIIDLTTKFFGHLFLQLKFLVAFVFLFPWRKLVTYNNIF